MKREWPTIRKALKNGVKMLLVDCRIQGVGERRYFKLREREQAEDFAERQRTLRKEEGTGAFFSEKLVELAGFGWSKERAIDFVLEHLRNRAASVTVSTAIEEIKAEQEDTGLSKGYRDTFGYLMKRLDPLADSVIANVTTAELQAVLRPIKNPGTRNAYRRYFCRLWSFAESRGWVRGEAVKTATAISRVKKKSKGVGILQLDELQRLLDAASPEVLPALVIAAFCPIRQAELAKLTWDKVNLDECVLTVDAAIAKTSARRTIKIPANAVEWLKSRVWTGPIVPNNFRNEFDRVRVKAGFKPSFAGRKDDVLRQLLANAQEQRQKLEDWPSNGLRHSAISYRLAVHRNTAEVAIEAGNSPTVIQSHYLELVMPRDAERYFAIRPPVDQDEAYRKELTALFDGDFAAKAVSARKETRAQAKAKK